MVSESTTTKCVVCVCLIWGCQGVVREARLFETKGTLCAYVPLLPNKGARECENARMQAQCECNRTSGEQCSICACECLACSYVRKKRHMCLLFRTSGKQRMWPVCVSMLNLPNSVLVSLGKKLRPKRHLAAKCTSVYLERQWCPETHCIALCGPAIGIH